MDTALELLLRAAKESDQATYRPVFFNLPADGPALHALLKRQPDIRITDRIETQLRELVKSKHPQEQLSGTALETKVHNHLGNSDLITYGSWIFYPWNDHLVHLLDAEEFAMVRTDRNRNKITREEQALLATKKVGVVGLSVGQSVSITMALERCFGEIRLADFDTLDLSNLNRLRTGIHHLGLNKAVITAREIAEIDPYLKVTCFTDGLTKDNMDAFFTEGGKLDILVEECDSVDIKILARQKAKELRIPVVMDMSDRGCLDVERFDLEPARPLMHGWIDHLDLDAASRPMSAEEKVPYMLPITGMDTLSPRMKASVIELGQTVSTWPQLATSVALGGALAGDAIRRIALNQFHKSGRWFVDLEELVADDPAPLPPPPVVPPAFHLTSDELATIEKDLGLAPAEAMELGADIIEQLVKAGGLAPSAGNMQPWKFLWTKDRLVLFHDVPRSYSALDPDHRIAHIALGACMENIVLKAHALGYEVNTRTLDAPSPAIAAFSFHKNGNVGQEPHVLDHLADQIGTRCTNRRVTDRVPLSESTVEEILAAANMIGSARGRLYSSPEELTEIASICGQAERIRVLNRTAHHEFFGHEMRWNEKDAASTKNGLDIATMEIGTKDIAGLRVLSDPRTRELLETWEGGRNLEGMAKHSIGNSSAVLLITTKGDDIPTRLTGGRAAERAWLAANAMGLSVHPVAAPIFLTHILPFQLKELAEHEERELLTLKDRMANIFQIQKGEYPLFMMRISKSDGPSVRSFRLNAQQLMAEMPN